MNNLQNKICVLVGKGDEVEELSKSKLFYVGPDKHPSGSRPIRLLKPEAASWFIDKTISCVFLTNPNYTDLCLWWSKVAVGGCIAGRAFNNKITEEDQTELNKFADIVKHKIITEGSTWQFIKSPGEQTEILPDCDIAIISGDCGASSWAYQLRQLSADRAMLDRLTPLIPKDTVVIDAGAFIGSHASEYLKFSENVWAFEPNPAAFSCLAYNCPKATVHNIALGAEEGVLYWNRIYPNCGGSYLSQNPLSDSIEVQVKPLDYFVFKKRVGFIKVDVEGMELQFLKGAEKTINCHKPTICMEINNQALRRNAVTPEDIYNFFEKIGYKVEPIWPGQDEDYKKNHEKKPESGFQWDIIATPKEPEKLDPIVEFHKKYYNSCVWVKDTKWMGVSIQKYPGDLMIYQEMIFDLKPDLIIETGTCFGGSALFFAQICDLVGNGNVFSIDIQERLIRPTHTRLTYLTGSSIDTNVFCSIQIPPSGKILVFLDSDHKRDHVLAELELYSQLIIPGFYIVVEDTNIDGQPIYYNCGPGPMRAVEKFLETHPEFEIDKSKEKYLMTQNPNGFLRRK